MADALPDPVVVNPFRFSGCGAAALPNAHASAYCGAPPTPPARPLEWGPSRYPRPGRRPQGAEKDPGGEGAEATHAPGPPHAPGV